MTAPSTVEHTLRIALEDGPDAANPLPNACPDCNGDVEWERIIAWRYYPEGNGYRLTCTDCTFEQVMEL